MREFRAGFRVTHTQNAATMKADIFIPWMRIASLSLPLSLCLPLLLSTYISTYLSSYGCGLVVVAYAPSSKPVGWCVSFDYRAYIPQSASEFNWPLRLWQRQDDANARHEKPDKTSGPFKTPNPPQSKSSSSLNPTISKIPAKTLKGRPHNPRTSDAFVEP